MIIEKALKKAGMKLEGDVFPKDQRTQKHFKRAIAALRACEAEELAEHMKADRELNEAQKENLRLHERLRVIEAELLQLRLKDRLEQIPALTVNDRTRLLECSGIGNGAN